MAEDALEDAQDGRNLRGDGINAVCGYTAKENDNIAVRDARHPPCNAVRDEGKRIERQLFCLCFVFCKQTHALKEACADRKISNLGERAKDIREEVAVKAHAQRQKQYDV